MKIKFTLLFLMVSVALFSQKVQDKIQSKKLNEERNFSVILPASYENSPEKKYPILVLLDGEYLADPFSGILKYGNYWDDLPEIIIVAVNQNYGETRFNDSNYSEEGLPAESGAKFFEFIGFELLPYIQQKYRTLPFRIIAGHDTTAGFLNFYLYKDDPIFNAYISISPEMAPEMEVRIAERLAKTQKPVFYYQATSKADLEEIQENTKKLDDVAKEIKNPNVNYRYDVFQNTSHYSLVAEAIPSAFYFIFNGYQPISKLEFNEKILKLESGYTQYLIDKYDAIEKKIGLKVQPRYSDFKAIEAAIIKNKAYSELENLGAYADKQYPKTMLGTYHRGLYFEKIGDYKRAAKEYQSAYSKSEIGDLTKNYILNRAEDLKSRKEEPKQEIKETAPVETPTETPAEAPKKDE
ncbi:alpha/beta hydrolase [Flavobacterium sp.]|jgi:predicted alpha/beta superfamily hydrolase|uniref:alpha/beta hydrolase n=1 Tax=Flavobacterium sp. TaxID=239 RepID=UPI0037C1600D